MSIYLTFLSCTLIYCKKYHVFFLTFVLLPLIFVICTTSLSIRAKPHNGLSNHFGSVLIHFGLCIASDTSVKSQLLDCTTINFFDCFIYFRASGVYLLLQSSGHLFIPPKVTVIDLTHTFISTLKLSSKL